MSSWPHRPLLRTRVSAEKIAGSIDQPSGMPDRSVDRDHPAVIGLERAAMPDADHGRCRQGHRRSCDRAPPPPSSSVAEVASSRNSQSGLINRARAIASRCCSPSDSACAQCASSSRRLRKAGNPTAANAACASASRSRRRLGRKPQRLAQAPDRHVGPLRQEQRLGAGGQADAPGRKRPQSREDAEQRALAAARGSLQQDRLVRFEAQRHRGEQRRPIGQGHARHPASRSCPAPPFPCACQRREAAVSRLISAPKSISRSAVARHSAKEV